ncbi:MAG: plastocyanin/azurin family copper-binding protein [Microscillaceae bacterium]|nr:plastocyanin/azurin family copper-binding protein [Microscillaceae bacterium]
MKNISFLVFLLLMSGLWVSASAQEAIRAAESVYYQIEKIAIPADITLEVGGLVFDDAGKLAVCTRRGDVWVIEDPLSPQPKFTKFATGLHEPLGLNFKDGDYYLAQRGELTRLRDTDKDGKADLYENIYNWDLVGNYHEYSYGPVFLPNGDMLVTLNLGWVGRGASLSKWRGWMVKITPDGKLKPYATGMRSPAGFGMNAQGDIFYAENQGDWVGSGRITHLEEGDFAGHPEGLKWSGEAGSPISLKMEDISDKEGLTLFEYSKKRKEVKPPSVWFPHSVMGISTSDMVIIPKDFGPFAGQMLVGDQGQSKIMRVYQEKVKGEYQGACFPFKEGFSSGVLRMTWGKDNTLYVGMTSRGWSSTGPDMFGLEKLKWTKKVPFEIREIHAKPDGFELVFTQEINPETASKIESYQVSDFTYKYHHLYGSPPINLQEREIGKVELSTDRRKVRIFLDNLREGYAYEIKAEGIRNQKGESLLHNFAYYTLNNIPEGAKWNENAMDHEGHSGKSSGKAITSAKRITKMPADWGKPDVTLTINTVSGLKYDKQELTVKAGSKIKLVLNNPDDMLHNLLIVNPGTADEIAKKALALGLAGQEKGYVPESKDVLFHTALLEPNASDAIFFVAPSKPGDYIFVCTLPGHARSMRGILKVSN